MEFCLVPWLLRVHYPLDLSNALQVCETSVVVDPYRRLLLQVVVVHWLQLLRFLLVVVVVVAVVVLLLLWTLVLRLLRLDLLASKKGWLDLCELLHAVGSESSDAELT